MAGRLTCALGTGSINRRTFKHLKPGGLYLVKETLPMAPNSHSERPESRLVFWLESLFPSLPGTDVLGDSPCLEKGRARETG